MHTATLHTMLPEAAAGAAAPEWLHLIPAGTFKGADGRGPYRLTDAAAVIAASMASGKLPVDENHATDHAATTGQPSPARGWIVEMQAREDGIWGRVEWNSTGLQLMGEKAYRGLSPVFTHDEKGGTVRSILRAALTNTPNLTQLHTLHHRQDETMSLTQIRVALGLPEAADEAAILGAITARQNEASVQSAHMAAIAQAAGVNNVEPGQLVTVLQTRLAAAGETAGLAEKVVALQTQLQTAQGERARDKAVSFVDGAIKGGKPIAPLRDHYIARHMADAAAVEKEITGMPSLHAGGIGGAQLVALQAGGGGDMDALSADDMDVIQRMGLDPKKYAEQKRKPKPAMMKDGE